ncbi:MAG: ADOP family duplicated permease [Bryobacteraceae bacterium]
MSRKSPANLGLALYRYLANAYPHEFRMIYGEELDRLGEDAVPEVWHRYGLVGLVRLLADIAVRLPAEYLAEIRRDVVYSLRVLAGSPGFAAVGVLSMAIGIGMCSVILCGSNAILGPPPGVPDPAALATPRRHVSYPYFEHYRDQRQLPLTATALLLNIPFAVAPTADRSSRAERFYGELVSPEYFSTLGVVPAAGRFFRADTEKPGMAPVVVVGDRFWRSYLNSDPRAVGRVVRLNGQLATIVGIAPRDFMGMWPWNPADIFVPLTCGAALAPELAGDPLHRPNLEVFTLVVRLPRGLAMPAASAALDAVTRALDRQTPDPDRDRDPKGRQLRLMPAGTMLLFPPEGRVFMYGFNFMLWAIVVSLVCANLANLLLARGAQRRREIAVRLSMGASRARIVRQLLTESVLLSLAGGIAGILCAWAIGQLMFMRPIPAHTPFQMNLRPDFGILAFTLAVSVLAGIGFGLAPALACVRTDLCSALKEGAQAPLRGYRRFGLRNLFVAYQVAASLMLLLITGFMVSGYQHVTLLDPGFDTASLNLLSIDPVRDGYSAQRSQALFASLPDELARLAAVRAVALAAGVPFSDLAADRANTAVSASTGEANGREAWTPIFSNRIGADYFATLGVPLLRGRDFDRRDEQSASQAIVNQTGARALFGDRDPIGRRLREGDSTYTVIGVARDTRSGFLPPKPVATVFFPLTAAWFARDPAPRATILVRGVPGPETLAILRENFASLHPDLTVFDVHTMRENLARMNSFVQWSSGIYTVLGLFALLLACVGLGGVTAYAVAQRRKEIGIRMALGARAGQVGNLVLREGIVLVAAGTLVGLGLASAIARALSSVTNQLAALFETRSNEPLLIFGAPALLAALSLLACYLPARRATRIDPVAALREQ